MMRRRSPGAAVRMRVGMLLSLLLMPLWLFGQSQSRMVTISGFVRDVADGETLIGANIMEQKSKRGAVTNEFGHYSLVVPAGEVRLQVSYVGYSTETLELTLQADTTLQVALSDSNLLGEVVVTGISNPSSVATATLGAQRIAASQIKRLPAFLGEADVIKALQLMPGVQGGTEGSSGLYVRGGGPDQNLILMDGISLYNPNHLLGFFSAFNPDAVKSVTLYKGSFPARFGNRLSSVVDVRLKDGDMQQYHGNASIGLISSKLNVEGPIVKDKTTFNFSARRTYLDLIAGIGMAIMRARRDMTDEDLRPGYNFHDLNLKLTHRFSPDDQLYFFAYYGNDKVSTRLTERGQNAVSKTNMSWLWGNAMASLRWNHAINGQMFLNTTASYTQYRSHLAFKVEQQETGEAPQQMQMNYNSGIYDGILTSELHYTPHQSHQMLLGGSYTFHTFRPEMTSMKLQVGGKGAAPDPSDMNIPQINSSKIYAHEVALYAEDEMKLGEDWRIDAGLRYSFFHVRDKGYHMVEPRVGVAYRILPKFTAKVGYALMTQHVHLLSNNSLSLPTDLWVPSTDRIRPMLSHHLSAGLFLTIPEWGDFSVEGYYKSMKNVLEYKEGAVFLGVSQGWEQLVAMGRGTAYGVEFLWQRHFGKVTGWLAYTWSRAWRHFDEPGEELNFGRPFPAKYDRIHDFSVAVSYRLNDHWDFSATWMFMSGNTGTLPTHGYASADDPFTPYDDSDQIKHISGRNNYRFPAYHRLDLSVSYTKQHRVGKSVWNLSVYNAYNQMNPFIVTPSWRYDRVGGNRETRQMILQQTTLFPILPNISYTYSF